MTALFLINYLEKAGWKQVRRQGIHHILAHPGHPNLISIPNLADEVLKPSLVNDICREAGLKGRVHKIRLGPGGLISMVKNLLGFSR